MRVIVCGGRAYSRQESVDYMLDKLLAESGPHLTIIHGDGLGADKLADRWAVRNRVPVIRVPAPWSQHPAANRQMLELYPSLVMAFPGGERTRDMCRAARDRGVRVFDECDMVIAERDA